MQANSRPPWKPSERRSTSTRSTPIPTAIPEPRSRRSAGGQSGCALPGYAIARSFARNGEVPSRAEGGRPGTAPRGAPLSRQTVAAVTDGTALHAFVLGLVHREMGNTERSKEYGWLALRHACGRGAMDPAAQIQTELSP